MSELALLGNKNTKYPNDYSPEVLETFENKHKENDYFVKFKRFQDLQIIVCFQMEHSFYPFQLQF